MVATNRSVGEQGVRNPRPGLTTAFGFWVACELIRLQMRNCEACRARLGKTSSLERLRSLWQIYPR